MIEVLIVDDHGLFAESLADALGSAPDIVVGGTANDVPTAIDLVTRGAFAVAILDLELPGGGRTFLSHPAAIPAIVVSMHLDSATEDEVYALGATGAFSKGVALADLIAAVRAAAAGETIPRDLTERGEVLARFSSSGPVADLTDREIELLGLMTTGVTSTEQLAEDLFISQKTVKNHLASIYQKLGVTDRAQAVVAALRLGIRPPQ